MEVQLALAEIGLYMHPDKCSWMTNSPFISARIDEIQLYHDIISKKVDTFLALGVMLSADGTDDAALSHRIKQAWALFWKYYYILGTHICADS